jgi:nucleoside-diphosphate-sugar epimerase
MVVAVTGGTGFVGTGLVHAHLARGDEVRVLTRREAASSHSGARLFRGDLADADIPTGFIAGADVLYHCAGELRDETRMQAVHVESTRRLLEQATGSVDRWVQLSSVGVYGPRREGTITEETSQAPVGTYERTKAESDTLVRAASRGGALDAVILRPSNIFGAGMPNQSLFALFDAVDRGLFFFVGPKGASANYIPVENVVDALLLCGTSRAAAGEVFNLSAFTVLEDFIGMIAAALGKVPPRLRLPRMPLRAAAAVLSFVPGWPLTVSRVDALSGRAVYSTEHIESKLGYRLRVSVPDALRLTVAQWRAARAARQAFPSDDRSHSWGG